MGAVPYQALPLLRFFACKYSRAKKVRKGEGEPGNEAMICLSMNIMIISLILLCGPLFRSGGLRIKSRLG